MAGEIMDRKLNLIKKTLQTEKHIHNGYVYDFVDAVLDRGYYKFIVNVITPKPN